MQYTVPYFYGFFYSAGQIAGIHFPPLKRSHTRQVEKPKATERTSTYTDHHPQTQRYETQSF